MSTTHASPRLAWQALAAECLGSALLLCTVVGSGIMAERLSAGNAAIALLANTAATVMALVVLIETLGPISGAHFNPVVSVLMRPPPGVQAAAQSAGWHSTGVLVAAYVAAQLLGAGAGTLLAHGMFDLPLLQTSAKLRSGSGQWLAEAVATACLVFVIARSAAQDGPMVRTSVLVACTVGAAYWFTASTSFANPAAVFGRMLSNSFSGIAPQSALPFVAAQFLGGYLGWLTARGLQPAKP
jgi:glycerol uptake facilitator-like aquaporin